jgi:ADP-ribose pyrophosphatase
VTTTPPIETQELLSTPLFRVESRVFAAPDGKRFTRDVVVHPGAVVILPRLADGRIVFVRNHRYTVGEVLLELPAGTRAPGEEPVETAHREMIEETGYRARTIEPIAAFYTSPGVLTERMWAFEATGLEHVGQALEEGEQIEVAEIERCEARRMLAAGEFSDGKTIAVLGLMLARSEG